MLFDIVLIWRKNLHSKKGILNFSFFFFSPPIKCYIGLFAEMPSALAIDGKSIGPEIHTAHKINKINFAQNAKHTHTQLVAYKL